LGTTLAISDLHLSEATPAIEAGFADFLTREIFDQPHRVAHLLILGDFFEAWVGDDDDAPYVARLKELLSRVVASGTTLSILRGNRDFLLGEGFTGSVGATLLGDASVIDAGGTRALVMHGDTLCTDDVDYQKFREMAHHPEWRREMLDKPLAERKLLAQQLRAMSIDAASNKAQDIMDVNAQTVETTMRDYGVTLLIHGHTHRPARHAQSAGERVVLGDWSDTHGWCVRISEGEVQLEQFAF
jgi:UDP-2,3-diacylglucosamine hydrolase